MRNRLLALFAWLTLIGCIPITFKIEMRTEGKVLHRKLTCWKGKKVVDPKTGKKGMEYSQIPPEKLEHFIKLYPKRTFPKDPKEPVYVFEGTFEGKTPNDVGGSGTYTPYSTRMGKAFLYVERFGGDDDLARTTGEILDNGDKVADTLIVWFEAELGKNPRFGKLRKFVDERFRKDLKNLGLYGWTMQAVATGSEEAASVMGLRLFRYFADRGYFFQEDLPEVRRAIWSTLLSGDVNPISGLLRRIVWKEMGIEADDPSAPALAFLADFESVLKSLDAHLANTDAYKRLLKEWEEKKKTAPVGTKPEPAELFSKPFFELIRHWFDLSGILRPDKNLDIRLTLPVAPHETNGRWEEEKKQVTWKEKMLWRAPLPAFAYAWWSVPDVDFQKTHFGKVVLEGWNLGDYVLWRKSLKEDEAKEWDAFVSSLKPGPELKKRIESFRFARERKQLEKIKQEWEGHVDNHSGPVRGRILEGLAKAEGN